MSSDESLALRAAKGDTRAFGKIYERYHQDLYRFCLAMVGNPQDAQDALQNTMVKVLRSLPGEKREIRLKPWLYRIARNESVETLRKRRDNAELAQHEPAVGGLSETAEARERLRALLSDLDQLPERQRAALVMRELSGLDFGQIGAAFGTSPAVARQTLYEARLSLRQLEAGREMRCDEVMRELSDADGRVTRRREIQAHLRSCADCRAFRDDIAHRRENLAALSPLPLAVSAGLLHGLLGKAASASGVGGAAGGVGAGGAGAGKVVATSAILKGAATVAVAVVGVSAAQRSGLVDLPLPGSGGGEASQSTAPSHPSGPAAQRSSLKQGPSHAGGRQSHPGGGASAGQSGGQGQQRSGGEQHGSQVSARSKSQSGQAPPGGGYGRSASKRHGRPDQLPQASEHGQETAAGHKAPQAPTPPGPSSVPAEQGKSTGAGAPAPAPKAEPEIGPPPVKAPPTEPPPTVNEAPGSAPKGYIAQPQPAE